MPKQKCIVYTHDLLSLSVTRSWQLSRIFLKIECLLLVIYVHIRKYGDCNTLKYHNTSRCEAEECTGYWSEEYYKVSLSTDRSGLDVAIFFIPGLSINRMIQGINWNKFMMWKLHLWIFRKTLSDIWKKHTLCKV